MTDKILERSIFARFISAAHLAVDANSIEQDRDDKTSRRPDIVCRIDGVSTGFELTAATNEEIHHSLDHSRVAVQWIGPGEIDRASTSNEVVAALKRKLKKTYEFNGPLELIIHESLANLEPSDIWIDSFLEEVKTRLAQSQFVRVWVVGPDGSPVYTVWPATIINRAPE